MLNKLAPEIHTFERFMDAVISRVPCHKHDAELGDICWGIITSEGLGLGAICNKRAKRAGFSHKISAESMRSKKPGKK